MTTILPFVLLVLICPLAMIFMMRGMHGHGSKNEATDQAVQGAPLKATELRELRESLEARIEELDARIDDLEDAGPSTTGAGAFSN
jgi:hypothetical protein